MNVTKQEIDKLNAVIKIEIAKDDYEAKVEKTLRDYRKKANIPGFRPGMVPMGMIKKMYGKAVLGEEVNKLISEGLYDYIKENNLNILGEPLPNETEQKEINFDTDEVFEFVFDIAIAPEIDVTCSTEDNVNLYDVAVSDEMIDNQVKSYCGRFGKYEQTDVVAERDVLRGTMVEVNADKAEEDLIKVENASLSAMHMKDDAQKALLVGANKGATVTFNPKKAYENETEVSSLLKLTKEQATDVTSDFNFTIEAITNYTEAEVNQELFDKVYGEGAVGSEADFRTRIAEELTANLSQDVDYRFGLDAKDMLMKKMDGIEFPEAFLKRWVIATNENMTEETLEADFPKMIDELKWHLAKDKISKANDLKVETEEVTAYAKNIAKMQFLQYGLPNVEDAMLENYAQEMLKQDNQVRGIVERVVENKIFAIIKNNVTLNETPISVEDFNKLFEAQA